MNKLTNIRIKSQDGQSYSQSYPISTFASEVLLSQGSTQTLTDALNSLENQIDQLDDNKIELDYFNDQKELLETQINSKLNAADFEQIALKTNDLKSDAAASYQATAPTNIQDRQYAVVKDKNGYLSVNVPWVDTSNEIDDSIHGKMGQGYGICSTNSQTLEKKASIGQYHQIIGGVVSIYFINRITGNALLNINNTGAKPIRYQNKELTNQIVLARDTVTFIYDGEYYRIISIDRDKNVDTTYPSMTNEQADNDTSNISYVISPKVLNNKINKNINAKKLVATGDGTVTFSIN